MDRRPRPAAPLDVRTRSFCPKLHFQSHPPSPCLLGDLGLCRKLDGGVTRQRRSEAQSRPLRPPRPPSLARLASDTSISVAMATTGAAAERARRVVAGDLLGIGHG